MTDIRALQVWSHPGPASHSGHTAHSRYEDTTYRDVDHELVADGVVAHDGGLHLPAHVGEVHPLAGHELGAPRHARETRPYQLGLEVSLLVSQSYAIAVSQMITHCF